MYKRRKIWYHAYVKKCLLEDAMDGFTAERKQRFSQGISDDAYRFMGVHLIENTGYIFRVWAPNARSVRSVGDFNYWNTSDIMMQYTDGGI